MELDDLLRSRGMNRREFIKLLTAAAVAMGFSATDVPAMAQAIEEGVKKTPVIWMKGQLCTGCTCSSISTLDPGPAEVVLDLLSFRYNPTIMAAAGHQAQQAMEDTIKEGGYLLVMEGAVPTADDRFVVSGGKPVREKLLEASANAVAVVAVGACASFGGIPAAGPTGAVGVDKIVTGKPVINLPGCPVNPRWLYGTVMYYLMYQELPELDAYNRPKMFYGKLLHDNCPRRGRFERGEFLTDWNSDEQKDWCLLLMGCKGPKTYTDCPQGLWNDGVNFCINAGSPCSGCTQPEFYAAGFGDTRAGFSPLYARQNSFALPGLGGIEATKVGKVMAGVTAAGIGLHLAARTVSGSKHKSGGHSE
ncbi:MAG TPA: hydrogenase small subunit [Clostridia bacterium]|nr:hydrogenase small subunit [Clostridia bacterium]